MGEIVIVPATNDLLRKFYGKNPEHSMKAIVAMKGNEVIGVAGIYPFNSGFGMFSDTTEELRKNRKVLWKAARNFVMETVRTGLPVFARCDKLETADRFLRHLGFVKIDEEMYQWQGQPFHC